MKSLGLAGIIALVLTCLATYSLQLEAGGIALIALVTFSISTLIITGLKKRGKKDEK